MPDETQELRRIHWNECFGFMQIFRAFRLAIHPSKIVLALAGLLLTLAVGGILDAIWCAAGRSVIPGEIEAATQRKNLDAWREEQIRQGQATLRAVLKEAEPLKDAVLKAEDAKINIDKVDDYWEAVADLPGKIRDHYEDAVKPHKGKDKAAERAAVRNRHAAALARLEALERKGIFASLLWYERNAVRQAVEGASTLNFTGMMTDVVGGDRTAAVQALGDPGRAGPGLIPSVILMGMGVKWLVGEHWFFAILCTALVLAIWSFFGGAICRIAALHAARDEKISVKQAFGFARQKFLGFFAAPLIPIALIVFIGVFLVIAGLVAAIPYLGELVTGVLFFLVLIGGFVMTLVLVGAVGGGSLMWPTIAVEGSDSFDAISRSFSYVYAKPWRSLFYFLVASVYGAFCFLFVRLFVLLMLKLSRIFVGIGLAGTSRPAVGDGASKLDVMWRPPTFESLMPAWVSLGAEGLDVWGGFLIYLWVSLAVLSVYAFLISFCFSGSTLIYGLLRREVDATDLEEVYVEETEDEASNLSAEPAPAATPPPAAPAPPAPSSEPPSEAGGPAPTPPPADN